MVLLRGMRLFTLNSMFITMQGKQVQHEGPGVGVATRQGGRRHQQPHTERAQQSQQTQQGTLARLASDNLITGSNANAGLNGAALFTGVGQCFTKLISKCCMSRS